MTENPFSRKPEPREEVRTKVPQIVGERKCPDCASADVRKLSMVYESGTKRSTSVAVGMTGDGDVGGAVIGGTQQSLLASRLKPPTRASTMALRAGIVIGICAFIAGLVASVSISASDIGFFLLLVVVPLAAAGFGINWVLSAQRPKYEAALARWNSQWCCMRCGRVFA